FNFMECTPHELNGQANRTDLQLPSPLIRPISIKSAPWSQRYYYPTQFEPPLCAGLTCLELIIFKQSSFRKGFAPNAGQHLSLGPAFLPTPTKIVIRTGNQYVARFNY